MTDTPSDASKEIRIVYFEFEDMGAAEAFMEDVSDWLCERVIAPEALRDQALREIRQTNVDLGGAVLCPRYWLYNDASASMGPASEFFNRANL